jgi:hypothetical protein
MSREFCMAVKESAYTTPKATPVSWTTSSTYGLANADAYYPRLAGSNQQTVRGTPTGIVYVPYGGGLAVMAYAVSDKQEVKGKLTIPLTVGTAPFWLSWALQRVVGGTVPWTTTEPVGDLASIALYHGIVEEDFTIKRNVYLGAKCDAIQITCSEESTTAMLSMDITASLYQGNQFDSSSDPTSGTFPVPADDNLPSDPYTFNMLSVTGPVIGGATRTKITELAFNCNNALASRFYANRFKPALRWNGRKSTLAVNLAYDHTPDDRTNYQGLASNTCSFVFSNGTHSFEINMNANNVFDPLSDNLGMADIYFQSSTSVNMWDPVAGADLTLTLT